jgi:hypothetical protein
MGEQLVTAGVQTGDDADRQAAINRDGKGGRET